VELQRGQESEEVGKNSVCVGIWKLGLETSGEGGLRWDLEVEGRLWGLEILNLGGEEVQSGSCGRAVQSDGLLLLPLPPSSCFSFRCSFSTCE
jgi:hypothetical protein